MIHSIAPTLRRPVPPCISPGLSVALFFLLLPVLREKLSFPHAYAASAGARTTLLTFGMRAASLMLATRNVEGYARSEGSGAPPAAAPRTPASL